MSLVNKVLTKLRFSKNWNSKSDFPTYEMREEQVRADIQLLHDETQTAFNNLVDDLESLSAENIPFESSTEVPASNLQEAVENVQQQVAEASAATIPNGSITDEKLAAGVPTNKADLVGGIVKADQMRLRVKEIFAAYTLSPADIGYLMYLGSSWSEGRPCVVIPSDNSSIPIGSVFMFVRILGADILELRFDESTTTVDKGPYTLISPGTLLNDTGQIAMLVKLQANRWVLAHWSN